MPIDLSPTTLEGSHVRLVPLSLAHCSRLCEIGLDPELWKSTIIKVQTEEDMYRYVQNAFEEQSRGTSLPFVIIDKASDLIVGTTRFHSISTEHSRLEIGFTWIAPEWQRTVINTETKFLLLQRAFESFGCVRVEFKTNRRNEQSRRALLRLGARKEGVLRNYMSSEAGAKDVVVFSITSEDWPTVKSSLQRRLDSGERCFANNYDSVAAAYSEHFKDELSNKPFDRRMLDWLIDKSEKDKPICDMGCGPGQIARYLCDRGANVCGIDLSLEMIRNARLLNPDIRFEVGDMLNLKNVESESFGGIAAFYSIVHFTPALASLAFSELRRVLTPHGILLVTHHIGSEVVHRDELLGVAVDLDFRFFETGDTKTLLEEAGFSLEEAIERDPYPDVEHPSRRAYIFARKSK